MPSLVIRRYPNPPSGIVVTVNRALEHIPAGARAVLLGSLFRYERISSADRFEIEYEGRTVTVRRGDLE